MKDRMHRFERLAVVFIAGAVTLALEVLAVRTVTPAFGGSVYVWGAVLSVTLLALAAGYTWGGRLADLSGNPDRRLVVHVLLAAGWAAALPLWDGLLARASLAMGAHLGPLLAAFLLLAPSMTLLATVTPLAFGGMWEETQRRPGSQMGGLFAISTAGSVLGALLTAYVALPWLGVTRSNMLAAGLLLAATLPMLWRGAHLLTALVLLGGLLAARLLPGLAAAEAPLREGVSFLERGATRYAQLDILHDVRDDSRMLFLDGAFQSGAYEPDLQESPAEYVRLYADAVRAAGHEDGRVLQVGLGGGILPRLLERRGFEVVVVEIDPGVIEAAERWFGFDPGQSEVVVGDGRTFMERAAERGETFDLILVDVAGGGGAEHLLSREAFAAARDVLAPGGLFALNHVGFLEEGRDRPYRHLSATLAAVFPEVAAWDLFPEATGRGELGQAFLFAGSENLSSALVAKGRRLPVHEEARPLTDEWNPLRAWGAEAQAAWRRNTAEWVGSAALAPR